MQTTASFCALDSPLIFATTGVTCALVFCFECKPKTFRGAHEGETNIAQCLECSSGLGGDPGELHRSF